MNVYVLEYKGKYKSAFSKLELAEKGKLKFMSVVKEPALVKIKEIKLKK